MAFIGGVIWLFAAGLSWVGERVLELTAGAALVGAAIWVTRRMVPRFAEFDGQVLRQTFIEHDEDPDEYRVVVDDGAGATAWDLQVPAGAWRQLTPGTFVHARVNLHNREVTIDRGADRTHRAVEVRQGHGQLLPGAPGRGPVRDRVPVPVPRGPVRPGVPGAGRGGGVRSVGRTSGGELQQAPGAVGDREVDEFTV